MKVDNSQSIYHINNRELLKAVEDKKIFVKDEGFQINNAAPSLSGADNILAPLGKLAYIDPEHIKVLTAGQVADEIGKNKQQGAFGDKTVIKVLKEYTGTTSPDDGQDDGQNSDLVVSTEARGVYYHNGRWEASYRDVATFQRGANMALLKEKADSAMEAIAYANNNIFFSGVAHKMLVAPVYGLLNEPSIKEYDTQDEQNNWATAKPETIYNELMEMLGIINKNTEGMAFRKLAQSGSRILILCSARLQGYLERINEFKVSVVDSLNSRFGGKVEVIAVPQFEKAQSSKDVCYVVILPDELKAKVILNSYVEKAHAFPTSYSEGIYKQKITSATSGCMVQYPQFVHRRIMQDAPA